MKSEKVTALTASYDNRVQAFLVKYCEESPEYSERLVVLYGALKQANGMITRSSDHFRHKHMASGSFSKRLHQAGFTFSVVHDSERRQNDVTVHGLRLKQKLGFDPGDSYTYASPSTDRYVADELEREELYQPFGSKEYPDVDYVEDAMPLTASATHIEVDGAMYKRCLIARISLIRGFIDNRTNREKKYIVTFSNPEMKHKFVTEADGRRIAAQLGL